MATTTLFDKKAFNPEVFGKYVDTVSDLKRNELIRSGAFRVRNDIKNLFPDQTGGNYAKVPMKGFIDGSPVNYDGSTDITASSRKTYTQGMIVTGRAKGFIERDFSSDITGGNNFLPLAREIAHYWDNVDQDTLLSILKGIFSMTGAGNTPFVNNHTYDIAGEATNNVVSATSLNTAVQKALGDNKNAFTVAIMHSAVATNLENLSLLEYLKYTDENGVQRDLTLGTWNGRVVLIDDNMPVDTLVTVEEVKGIYTIAISDAFTTGEKFTLNGVEYAWVTADPDSDENEFTGATVDEQGASLAPLLQANNSPFTVTFSASTDTLSFTQRVGGTGAQPVLVDTDSNLGDVTEATKGVAEESVTKYTTYILGRDAFYYADCGVTVPFEMDRDPKTNGGETTLYTRQRKIFAPKGISFEPSIIPLSPTNDDLEKGASWSLLHDGASAKSYINHKHVPIARIVSRG